MDQNLSPPELRAPWARFCCVLLLLMVTWCLLTPHPPENLHQLQDHAWRGDLLIHLSVFTMVTFFILSLCSRERRGTGIGGAIAFAIITELLQILVPSRTCDPFDMLANLMGVTCGYGLVLTWQQMLQSWGRDFLPQMFYRLRDSMVRSRGMGQTPE